MIIKAFSEYLKTVSSDITPVLLLSKWLKLKLSKKPENNIERVINHEIAFIKDKKGNYMLIGKTNSGKILLESLYNFALSYEQHSFTKWIHNLKASDFYKNL